MFSSLRPRTTPAPNERRLCPRYKFARLFPLNQKDLPEALAAPACSETGAEAPACDYTPPQYIKLLFTDLGVLTPAAVSDELIRLYS